MEMRKKALLKRRDRAAASTNSEVLTINSIAEALKQTAMLPSNTIIG
jgi:hypothetical protein